MQKKFFSNVVTGLIASASAIAVVGCAPHNPAKPDDLAPAKAQAKTDAKNGTSDSLGGQPGKISLFGEIAKITGPNLILIAQTGLGVDGKIGQVATENQPLVTDKLPDKAPPIGAISEEAQGKVYAYGCDDKQISRYLERGSGKADQMSPDELKDFNSATANISVGKLLLCGQDPIKASTSIAINTRDLILFDLNLNHTGAAGINIQAENLTIVGKNEINSVSQPAAPPALDAVVSQQSGPIDIVISKNVRLNDDGKLNGSLKITAKGADAKKAN
jgi:hypothetical protein